MVEWTARWTLGVGEFSFRELLFSKMRLKEARIDLARIDRHSWKRRRIALHLTGSLEELDAKATVNNPSREVGDDVGHVIAHLNGTVPGAKPRLSALHEWLDSDDLATAARIIVEVTRLAGNPEGEAAG